MSDECRGESGVVIDATTPVAEAARAVLASRLATVRKRIVPVRAGDHALDDEVHGIRVATRRASSALRVFRPVVGRDDRRGTDRMLRRLRRAAAVARCGDVHAGMLVKMVAGASGARASACGYALGRISTERALGRLRLGDAARRVGVKRLARRHERLLEGVRRGGSRRVETFGELAQLVLADTFDRLELAMGGELSSIDRLHDLRLAVKRFRYVLEVVEPCLDPSAMDEAMTRARALQQRLGELNDLAELEARLERYAHELEDSERSSGFAPIISGLRVVQGEIDRTMRERREAFAAWWGGMGGPGVLASLRMSLLTVVEPPATGSEAASADGDPGRVSSGVSDGNVGRRGDRP